jgi:hypothetical protein
MTTKLVLVLLILVAVGFVFASVYGSRNNSSFSLPSDRTARIAYMQQHQPPAFVSSLIGRFSPKLVLDQKTIRFSALPLTLDAPQSTAQFRTAAFRVTAGCVSASCPNVLIGYASVNGEGSELDLDAQQWTPSNKPGEASLVILPHGGKITFSCSGSPVCVAELQ